MRSIASEELFDNGGIYDNIETLNSYGVTKRQFFVVVIVALRPNAGHDLLILEVF
jgi:hypothetical protein